jgi:MFS family permease
MDPVALRLLALAGFLVVTALTVGLTLGTVALGRWVARRGRRLLAAAAAAPAGAPRAEARRLGGRAGRVRC